MKGLIGYGACAPRAEITADAAKMNKIEEIDDSQPLWRFLSTHIDVAKAFDAGLPAKSRSSQDPVWLTGDCLYFVIERMIAKHNEFLDELAGFGVLQPQGMPLEPLELTMRNVALADVRREEDLHLSVKDEGTPLEQQSVQLKAQLHDSLAKLDLTGSFAKLVQRNFQADTRSFNFEAIRQEVQDTFLCRLVHIANPESTEHLRRICRFRQAAEGRGAGDAVLTADRLLQDLKQAFDGSSSPSSQSEEHLSAADSHSMYHSLDYEQLAGVLRAIDVVVSFAMTNYAFEDLKAKTVIELLGEMYPGTPAEERLDQICCKAVIADEEDMSSRRRRDERLLVEDDQRLYLLKRQISELPSLLQFVKEQLTSQNYIYAHLPLVLKERLSDEFAEAVSDEGLRERFEEPTDELAAELPTLANDLEKTLLSWPNIDEELAKDPQQGESV